MESESDRAFQISALRMVPSGFVGRFAHRHGIVPKFIEKPQLGKLASEIVVWIALAKI